MHSKKIDEVNKYFDYAGQSSLYTTKQDALESTKYDYFKDTYFVVKRIMVNKKPMYQCVFYNVNYNKLFNDIAKVTDKIYEKVYHELPKKSNPDKLLLILDKIDKYINMLGETQINSPTDNIVGKYYINKKNKHRYLVTGTAINCTNKDDGMQMVIYNNEEGMVFVREYNEFLKKFEETK